MEHLDFGGVGGYLFHSSLLALHCPAFRRGQTDPVFTRQRDSNPRDSDFQLNPMFPHLLEVEEVDL